jgi:hypothetical protein
MNRKGMEMTVNTVVVFVIALVLLGVSIYIIYTKILKPSGTATSLISCDSRGGTPVTREGCKDPRCAVCPKLDTGDESRPYCCIGELAQESS